MNTHDDNHIPEGAEIFQDIPPIYENDDGIEDEYADDEIEVDISPAAFQLAIQETSLFFKLSIDELSNKLNNVSVELWKTAMDLNVSKSHALIHVFLGFCFLDSSFSIRT